MHGTKEILLGLGLSDKEALVYLAMLELGPSPVQQIAEKADVIRSTAYLLLESLKKRGLVSTAMRGKKMLFAAEPPSALGSALSKERRRIDEEIGKLEKAMPHFMALYNSMEEKPALRFFEGEEGLVAARELLMRSTGEYLSFTAIDEGTERMARINEQQRLRMSRRIRGRTIFALKPGCIRPASEIKNWEVRELPYGRFPFTGELNITGRMVGAFVVKTRPMAFIMESAELADLFRAMFMAAWQSAQPVDKKRIVPPEE